jgi:hypothetical protein
MRLLTFFIVVFAIAVTEANAKNIRCIAPKTDGICICGYEPTDWCEGGYLVEYSSCKVTPGGADCGMDRQIIGTCKEMPTLKPVSKVL